MLSRNRKKQTGTDENAEHVSSEDLEEIANAGGVYSEQAISALLAMAGGEGITVTEETLNEVIKWDEVKKGWVFAAGKGLEDLLGAEIPEYIKKAVDTSENVKDLNNKVNAENTANAIIDSFTNLYTNAEEATLEGIKSLYDSIYGENAFANSGETAKWQAAI